MSNMNDEKCIEDLETLRQYYIVTTGAEPMCLEYAIERLKVLSKYSEIKITGETRKE